MPLASIGDSFDAFFDAVGDFFGSLAAIQWLALFPALIAFLIYLTLRARAAFNILRAAYPDERIQFRFIWGAYFAGYGFNAIVPARGGDVVRLFLTKTSVPNSSYPAVAAAFSVELLFDLCMAIPILAFAFTQGVFPKPPDFSKLPAFDLAFFAGNPQFTLFLLTVLGIATLAAFALLSARVRRFWERVRQGLTILFDRRRYFREVFAIQFVGWLFRFTAFFLLLEAFNVGGSVRNVLLVLGVNVVAALVPFTPGGAGVQQALLVKVFARYRRGRHRGRLLGRAADRHRRVHLRRRLRGALLPVPHPLLQGGHRAGACRARRGGAAAGGLSLGDHPRLGEALARLAHQRDGLGEHRRHHRADLLGLLLGVALEVDAVDRGDRHVDRELDRVVRPGEVLGRLHLLGHVLQPLLEIRVVEEASEAFHDPDASRRRARGRRSRASRPA